MPLNHSKARRNQKKRLEKEYRNKMNRATNSAVMRVSNRKLILNMIRLCPISRAELAQKAQLTRASVTLIVEELLEAGLVEPCMEAQEQEAAGMLGRKRTLLALKHQARFAYGVHLTRHRCWVGLVDLYGDVMTEQEFVITGMKPEEVLDQAAEQMERQRQECAIAKEHILGIGVSAPGPVDYRDGIILNPPKFENWHHTPVCDMLQKRMGLSVYLEKDTNARAMEEKYFGVAREFSGFMLVQIDEGVGSGVVVGDTVYRGNQGMGSEIGHTTICYDGPKCSCGNRGCLENYLSIPALLKDTPFESWHQLTKQETDMSVKILDQAAEYLAAALTNAINLYDLQKVILTGEVAACPDPLLHRVNALLYSRVISPSSLQEIPVVASRSIAPVRTGAMAVLCEFFQGRS